MNALRIPSLLIALAFAPGGSVVMAQSPPRQSAVIAVDPVPHGTAPASSTAQTPAPAFPGPPPVIAAPADAAPPAAAIPAYPPGYRPGLLDAMGQFMGQGVANWNAGFDAAFGAFGGLSVTASKGALDAAKGMGDAAKGASDAAAKGVGASMGGAAEMASSMGRLSAARVIAGRERCTVAPNGGPDCAQAAEALCKLKGYATGRSVDFETSEKCPNPTLVAGRRVRSAACVEEHFVIQAFCQ